MRQLGFFGFPVDAVFEFLALLQRRLLRGVDFHELVRVELHRRVRFDRSSVGETQPAAKLEQGGDNFDGF